MPEIIGSYQVPSESNPNRFYTVTLFHGYASCTCPAWRNQKADPTERVCKHVETITGELREGDGKLSNPEAAWVVRKVIDITGQDCTAIADAVEKEMGVDGSWSPYEKYLGFNLVETLRESWKWEGDRPPGPDAHRALLLVHRTLDRQSR